MSPVASLARLRSRPLPEAPLPAIPLAGRPLALLEPPLLGVEVTMEVLASLTSLTGVLGGALSALNKNLIFEN